MNFFKIIVFIVLYATHISGDEEEKDPYKSLKKSVLDYSDADIEKLYDQWEEAEDEQLPEDELPQYKRQPPKIDMSKFDPKNPEAMIRMSKKGQTLMMFATVSGDPTERETEEISAIWQSSLFNAQIETQRYVVGSDRILFMLNDGSTAWGIKDFLIEQERCGVITIEGKDYHGKGSPEYGMSDTDDKKKKSNGKTKKKTEEDKKAAKKSENEINKNSKTEL